MADLLGLTAILFISLLTFLVAFYWPKVAKILFVALAVRITTILIGYYLIDLPDSGKDALRFEQTAWVWAQNGFLSVLHQYPGPSSSFISWIIGLLYSFTGRSLLMAQSISLFFGMGSVFMGWLLARHIWDEKSATKAGWFFALYPSLILYSCLTLRETYISFFLLVAIFGIVIWAQNKTIKSIIFTMSGFFAATFFHGGMIIGAGVFILIVLFQNIKSTLVSLKSFTINLKAILIIFSITLIMVILFYLNINIPKLGTLESAVNSDQLLQTIKERSVGDASYPQWLVAESKLELIYKGPIRILYFIFSPFPWEIEKISHLFGVFDSVIFGILMFIAVRNRKVIWENLALRTIVLVIASYFITFGLVVGNFGTAIRHRTKFIIVVILIIAPLLPKFIFSKKIKNNK